MHDQEITLTAREFDLLWTLARHPRQVFNRDQLLDLVWGITEYIDASTVTVHVRRLREKIEPIHPTRATSRLCGAWDISLSRSVRSTHERHP